MAGDSRSDAAGQGGKKATQTLGQRALFGLALLSLLLALGIAAAFAQGEDSSPQGSGPTVAEVEQAIQNSAPQAVELPHTDPRAAEELPHRDLSRSQAIELLSSVFGPELQGPAGIYDELEVEKFYSDNVALIAAGDQPNAEGEGSETNRPTLLESALPLRTEGPSGQEEAVDLGLEHGEGEIQPANPLVEIGIPTHIEEGISMPESGVEIELAGAPAERSPSTVAQSIAAYPGVAQDTSFAVAASPTGLETLTLLQSAEAPTSQRFNLTLPSGASLKQTEDGGAEISQADGDPLVLIRPPSALDATGKSVPVSLETDGHSIILRAAPSEENTFPILVDPLWETYTWFQHTTTSFAGWSPYSNSSEFHTTQNGMHEGVWDPGLQITSGGGSISPGAQARWDYHVPRWGQDMEAGQHVQPTSFINRVIFEKLYFNVEWNMNNPMANDPFLAFYLWDEHNGFIEIKHRYGTEGNLTNMNYQYNLYNTPPPNENTSAKQASLELVSSQTYSQYRELYVGWAAVELSDKAIPGLKEVYDPAGWVNNSPTVKIPFEATDTGLGVYEMRVWEPTGGGSFQNVGTHQGCTGGNQNPCPRTWGAASGPAANYDPSMMPQGEDIVTLTAVDALGQLSQPPGTPAAEVKIKVDHTPPSLTLAGTATEQGTLGATLPRYSVKPVAKDGTAASPQSGVFKTVIKVDGKVEDEYKPGCPTKNCEIVSHEWTLEASKYSAGKHMIEVIATDGVNLSTAKTLQVETHPDLTPPSVALSGSMTEQASLGTTRPRYTLKLNAADVIGPDGSGVVGLASTFGTAGSGNGQFNHPADVAVDSKGNLWAVDENNNRIEKFNEKGEYLAKYGLAGSGNGQFNHPSSIAIDSEGNLLVADTGNNRIEKFNEKGEYLSQFGSLGGGNGQLKEPTGIAITPPGPILVADRGNHRVEQFTKAGAYFGQKGSYGWEDAQFVEPTDVTIGGPSGESAYTTFVTDSGNNRVQRFAPGGIFLSKFGSAGSGAGQFNRPEAVSVDAKGNVWIGDQGNGRIEEFSEKGEYLYQFGSKGSGSGQFSLGYPFGMAVDSKGAIWIADANNNRVQKWTPALGSNSGVTSTTIKVDGKVVDSTSPGCPAGSCSINREWSLTSDSYSPGQHTVEATATDGAGFSTAKSMTFNIERDTTVPQITANSSFFTAPEGWVEQKTYNYSALASDTNGYGATSVVLKVDGQTVKSASGTCSDGSCEKTLSGSIDTGAYDGGAHAAELIATDGAGNVAKKTWTLNVDPAGQVSAEEVASTLEAVEATSESQVVAPTDEVISADERAGGNDPALVKSGETLKSTGTPDTSTLALHPQDGFTVATPEGSFQAEPVGGGEPTPLAVTEGVAATSGNAAPNVDTVIRPVYNGVTYFQDIRDTTAPGTFSWEVHLHEGQSLHLLDSQHAAVEYEEGRISFLISAEPAHDAIGATVPTTLSTENGNVVTLTIAHKSASFVYPVIAGTGWEGGFHTIVGEMPPPEAPPETLAELEEEMQVQFLGPSVSAPRPVLGGNGDTDDDASISRVHPDYEVEWTVPGCSVFSCKAWELVMEGVFYMNHHYAWWRNSDPPPFCTPWTPPNVSMSVSNCDWVGKNHQIYGHGYHISAQAQFSVTKTIPITSISFTDYHTGTIYMYGSGYVSTMHNTSCICNPLP